MKPILFIALLLIFPSVLKSQIQKVETPKYISIGKWKAGGKLVSEFYYSVDEDKDTSYHWMYSDGSYTYIDSYEWIHFSEDGNTLNELYKILKESFEKEKGYEVSFKLGNDLVVIKTDKSFGSKFLYVSPPKGFFALTKNGFEKLFGKR